MNDNNPYAPPGILSDSRLPAAAGYVPLGWRTTVVAVALVGRVVTGAVVNASEGSLEHADVGLALAIAAAGLGLVVSVIGAVVFFFIWIHRAHKNLPALGRHGMDFTPGMCIGCFFIPIVNLWKPLEAVTEIWKASDPDREEHWRSGPSSPWLGVWWGTWLVGNVLESASSTIHSKSGTPSIDLLATACLAVAAVVLIVMMREIDQHQAARATRIEQAER